MARRFCWRRPQSPEDRGIAHTSEKTDGSPAVTLGEGAALALWAEQEIGRIRNETGFREPDEEMIPTGAGVRQSLPPGEVESFGYAFWTPDDKRVIFAGRSASVGLEGV